MVKLPLEEKIISCQQVSFLLLCRRQRFKSAAALTHSVHLLPFILSSSSLPQSLILLAPCFSVLSRQVRIHVV